MLASPTPVPTGRDAESAVHVSQFAVPHCEAVSLDTCRVVTRGFREDPVRGRMRVSFGGFEVNTGLMEGTALCFPQGGRCGLTSSVALLGAKGHMGHSHGFRSICGNSTLGRGQVQGPVRAGTRLPQQPAVLRSGPWARKRFLLDGSESPAPGVGVTKTVCFLHENVTLGDLSPILAKTVFLRLSAHPVLVGVQRET